MVHRLLGGLAAVLLLLASCGDPAPSEPASPSPAGDPAPVVEYPLTITDDDGAEVTIEAEPRRIVTFAPSMTEIVFALGLGDQLVGVSGPFDDFPGRDATCQLVREDSYLQPVPLLADHACNPPHARDSLTWTRDAG